MRAVDIVSELLTAKPAQQKKAVRSAWKNCDDFFVGVQMSMDAQWHMALDKVPEIQDPDDGDPGDFTFAEFCMMWDLLRQADANTAKEVIREAAERANITEWNLWYRKILLQRLHVDLPMPIIVDVLKQLTK